MSVERDALSSIVEAALKSFRGEEVDVESLARLSSRSLSQSLADLKLARELHRELKSYIDLIRRAASLLAELLSGFVEGKQQEFLRDYVAGLVVSAEGCLVFVEPVGRGFRVRCVDRNEALALLLTGRGEPLHVKVNDL